MKELRKERFTIGEASRMLDVPVYVLRQWEDKVPQLNPARDRAQRRIYRPRDIDIARRIKFYLRHEKMTLEGVRLRLAEELHRVDKPRSTQEALNLLDQMQDELRALLALLDEPME